MPPPPSIETSLVLVRWLVPSDAAAVAAAVRESLDHLRPWMPWASDPASCDEVFQEGRITESLDTAGSFEYGMFEDDGRFVGGIGLTDRRGPGTFEIGYWLHAQRTGRGYVTAAAGALTTAALVEPGIERIEIHCDETNAASAAVPRKLGYRLDRTIDRVPDAPAETGRELVWVTP